jgi:hypothetical protein
MSKLSAAGTLTLALLLSSGTTARAQQPTVTGRLIAGPPVEVRLPSAGFVTVLALGRGDKGNPIQLLSIDSPDAASSARPTRRFRARALTPSEFTRFATADEVVIVVIVSDDRPSYASFTDNGEWMPDLVVADSIASDSRRLVSELASSLYRSNTKFTAVLRPMDLALVPQRSPSRVPSTRNSAYASAEELLEGKLVHPQYPGPDCGIGDPALLYPRGGVNAVASNSRVAVPLSRGECTSVQYFPVVKAGAPVSPEPTPSAGTTPRAGETSESREKPKP